MIATSSNTCVSSWLQVYVVVGFVNFSANLQRLDAKFNKIFLFVSFLMKNKEKKKMEENKKWQKLQRKTQKPKDNKAENEIR